MRLLKSLSCRDVTFFLKKFFKELAYKKFHKILNSQPYSETTFASKFDFSNFFSFRDMTFFFHFLFSGKVGFKKLTKFEIPNPLVEGSQVTLSVCKSGIQNSPKSL